MTAVDTSAEAVEDAAQDILYGAWPARSASFLRTLAAERDAARAEAQRLREALRQIEALTPDLVIGADRAAGLTSQQMGAIARAALAAGGTP